MMLQYWYYLPTSAEILVGVSREIYLTFASWNKQNAVVGSSVSAYLDLDIKFDSV